MHQPRRLRLTTSILLCFVLQALGADKYTDENRPYEFGFKIDGQQHRHESKDKDGIIMGEFGFVTADDVYHVTVYATDKEGRFKILAMKNIHLKSSTALSLGAPTSARQGHALALPPAQPASVQAVAVSQQQGKQGGTPTRPQQGSFAPQAPVPQGAFATQPEKPKKPVAIEPPGKSCSSCSLPTTTTRAPPPQLPAYSQVTDNNNYNSPNRFGVPEANPQNQQAFPPSSPGQQNIAQGGPIGSSYSPQGGQQNYPSSQQNIPQQELIAPGGAPSFAPQPGQTPQNYQNTPNDSQKPYAPNKNAQPGGEIFSPAGQTQAGAKTQAILGQTNSGEHNRLFGGNKNPNAGTRPSGSATSIPEAGNYANGNGQQSELPGQSFYPQGSPGQISYQQGAPGQSSSPQGSPGLSSYPQGSPGQSSYRQGAPGQSSSPQGSAGVSSYPQGSPGQSSYPQGAPRHSSSPQGSAGVSSYPQSSPGQSSYPQGAPRHSSSPQGSAGVSSYPQSSPGQSSYPQGAPGQGSSPQGSPGLSSYPQGSPGQRSYPQRASGQSSSPQGSPGLSLYPQGSPGQGSPPQRSPGLSSYPQGSPGQDSSYPQGGTGERTAKQYKGLQQQFDSQSGPNRSQDPGAAQIQRSSAKPTLFSAQMQIVDKNTDIYALGPNEQKGLPPGLNQGDVTTLLYTFNYTLGFHGHFEEGYTNGVKKGYYFVTGRNGVRTRIDYVADDTGFHPTVSQEVLDLLSEDVPKPETEKDDKYGLKGYEFKWLYYPVESKRS